MWLPHPYPTACMRPGPSTPIWIQGCRSLTYSYPGSCTVLNDKTYAWVSSAYPVPIWVFYQWWGHHWNKLQCNAPPLPIPYHIGIHWGHRYPVKYPALPHQPLCWKWWVTPVSPGPPPYPIETISRSIPCPAGHFVVYCSTFILYVIFVLSCSSYCYICDYYYMKYFTAMTN